MQTYLKLVKTKPDDIPDDFNILRFLQADQYVNTDLGLKRFLSTLSRRQSFGVIDFPFSCPENMEKYKSIRI